jgi:hypothetical protein
LKKEELIKSVLDKIRSKCIQHYSPSTTVAVDESTVSFKGRVSFKTYNPTKPVKFELKMFVLSDSTNGYIYNFKLYTGKTENGNPDLLKTTQVVKELCSALIKDPSNPPSGYHVYTDRYYTSPQLGDELLGMNMVTTGTVMPSRKEMPEPLKENKILKMKQGDVQSFRKNDKLVLAWRDKDTVMILSTFHAGSKDEVTEVPSRYPNKPPTMKPNVVLDYTKYMEGVDRSDHHIASYQFMKRTKKWYRKMFFWLLEVSIVNSLVQEQYSKRLITLRSLDRVLWNP